MRSSFLRPVDWARLSGASDPHGPSPASRSIAFCPRARAFWFLICSCIGLLSGAHAASINLGERVSAQVETISGVFPDFGFLPVRVTVANSSNRDGRWTFDFKAGVHSGGGFESNSLLLDVPANSSREAVIYLGASGVTDSRGSYSYSYINVSIEGPGGTPSLSLPGASRQPSNIANVAIAPSLEAAWTKIKPVNSTGGARGRVPGGVVMTGFEGRVGIVDPLRWPADWRVWSAFALVVMETSKWEALDDPRRSALREWVALGGRLMLSPESARDEAPATQYHGAGMILTLRRPLGLSEFSDIQGAAVVTGETSEPWSKTTPLLTKDDRDRLRITGGTRWLSAVLLVFGIVIGPVNLLVFAPAHRRSRLFLTVPVISLSVTALLVGMIIFRDGFGGEGTRRAFVTILPGDNKAVIFQQQVSRTGLLVGREFPLADDVLLGVEIENPTRGMAMSSRGGQRARLNGLASGDWFNSRTTQSHQLRRVAPTRARIELVAGGKNGGAPVVQSSLTTVLKDFVYADASGKRWSAGEVPPGRRVQLTYVPPGDTLAPRIPKGDFVANGGATELAPVATLPGIRWTTESVVYTGRVEAPSQP